MTDSELLALIGLFYDGIVSPDGWRQALAMLASMTTSQATSLVLWDRRNDQAMVGEQIGLPSELLQDYAAHYHLLDPGRKFFETAKVDHWYIDERDFGNPAIQRSAFYQELLKPHELDSTMAVQILGDGHGVDAFLSLSGRPQQRDMSAIAEQLKILLPHVRRAALLRLKLLDLSQQLTISAHTLDRFDFPLLAVTARGKVVLSNRLGEAWLSTLDNPLAAGSTYRDDMASLLSVACGLCAPAKAAGMRIGNGKSACFLTAIPLPESASSHWQGAERHALLMVNDPSRTSIPMTDLLQQIFQLTPAEIRLVQPLLEGATLKEATWQLNISIATGRTQLKSIFAKLGVRRQSELHRLLGRMAFLGPDDQPARTTIVKPVR